MFNDEADDADIAPDRATRGTALVPLVSPAESTAPRPRVRPNSGFVAQLIATAAHAPQTRNLCRASPEDAQASYRAVARRAQPQQAARATGAARVA